MLGAMPATIFETPFIAPLMRGLSRAIQAKALQPVGTLKNASNLDPDLLRLCVGCEPVEEIIEALREALEHGTAAL